MTKTVITLAFEEYKAQQEMIGKPVLIDEFVLANVPNQEADKAIDRSETVPPSGQIVFIGNVSQVGYASPNAVVYSLIMDTSVGDFDFNWIGLRNKSTGIIAAISHLPLVHKIKSITGVQNGNAITRSIMMSYVNAKSLTQINVDASTWQIDFTARLSGIDENERLANVDHYGSASFLENGFKVFKEGAIYKAAAGNGYVGGLRCELKNNLIIENVSKPAAVYLDVSLQGQLTSEWKTVFTLKSSKSILVDHVDSAGFKHYVTKIADIDANSNIIDTRFLGGTPAFERVDNAATNTDIDASSTANKHVKLPQLWRALTKKITAAFLGRTISTSGALQGGGNLSSNRNLSILDATTTQRGATLLTNSVTSTSTVLAATAKAVRDAYSLASSKMNQITADARYAYKNGDNSESFSASQFNGKLNGNAASASKLASNRAISISGDAEGSGEFNGESDITINVEVKKDAIQKAGAAEITYISKSQNNNLMMIINGELYTACGNTGTYANSGTGRGFRNNIYPLSMEFLSKVQFPDESTSKIKEVGGNGYVINYALFDNGDLYTWGENKYGVCGVGHANPIAFPMLAASDVTDVFAKEDGSYEVGRASLFIKKSDGYIYASGENEDGELGLGDTLQRNVFTKITSLGSNIKKIWNFGGWAGYAFAESNDIQLPLKVTGWNGTGALGLGHNTGQYSWVEAPLWGTGEILNILGGGAYRTGNSNVSADIATHVHFYSKSDRYTHVVKSSGGNRLGQLGLGDRAQRNIPEIMHETIFPTLKMGKLSAVAYYFVDVFNRLHTWGDCESGILGHGNIDDLDVPTDTGVKVSEVFSSGFDSNSDGFIVPLLYKEKSSKKTYGCGRNAYGYLGIGTQLSESLEHVRVQLDEELKMLGSFVTNGSGRILVGITITNRMYVWGYSGNRGIFNAYDAHVLTPTLINLPDLE